MGSKNLQPLPWLSLEKVVNPRRPTAKKLRLFCQPLPGKICYNIEMKIRENVPISELTTMRLGGPAKFVIEIESQDEVVEAFDFIHDKNLPFYILGDGANTIGHDEGFDGVIVMNKIKGVTVSDDMVYAFGGEEWDKVVEKACENDLTGIEALSKIPGTAGAAPVQNIGAYGQDVSKVLKTVEVYDTLIDEFKTLKNEDLKFSYRKSILNSEESGRYFVIAIALELKEGQMERPFYNSLERYIEANNEPDFSPKSIRRMVSAIRADKLPDPKERASSGSFFKNVYLNETDSKIAEEKGLPVYHGKDGDKINSGWLIEHAGLSGKTLHGMHVNEKAALVLINDSAKSYADLAAARKEIIDTVEKEYGYKIEQEPVEIPVR